MINMELKSKKQQESILKSILLYSLIHLYKVDLWILNKSQMILTSELLELELNKKQA